jgi:signal transduction histidine kinase
MQNNLLLDKIPLGIMTFNQFGQNINVNLAGAEFSKKTKDCLRELIYDLVSKALVGRTVEKICIYSTESDFCIWRINAQVINNIPPQVMVVIQDETLALQLQQAVLKAEKLAVAGQLAIGSLVEIRNPLTVARGFCQFIEGNKAVDYEYIEIISNELEQIHSIIDSGRSSINSQYSHLEFFYRSIYARLSKQIDSYKLVLVTDDFDNLAITLAEEPVNAIIMELINFMDIWLEANTNIIISVDSPDEGQYFILDFRVYFEKKWDKNLVRSLEMMAHISQGKRTQMHLNIIDKSTIAINIHLPIIIHQQANSNCRNQEIGYC